MNLEVETDLYRFSGDFIPVEEPKEDKSKKRVVREDGAGDGSDEDDDRIDMAAITGAKEREERREQFYSVQREGMLCRYWSYYLRNRQIDWIL